MSQSFHATRVLEEDGMLKLERLPFTRGDAVEIFISARQSRPAREFPLRGTVTRFDNPTETVAADDWVANR